MHDDRLDESLDPLAAEMIAEPSMEPTIDAEAPTLEPDAEETEPAAAEVDRVARDRASFLQAAQAYCAASFAPGGRGPDSFDGAGVVAVAARDAGLDMGPPNYRDALRLREHCEPITAEQAEPGDLVFFANAPDGPPSDVGIYLGEGEMLAAHKDYGVNMANLNLSTWQDRLLGYGRPHVFGPAALAGPSVEELTSQNDALRQQCQRALSDLGALRANVVGGVRELLETARAGHKSLGPVVDDAIRMLRKAE